MKKWILSAIFFLVGVLAGCGGSSQSSNTTPVLQSIQVSPGTASVAAGIGQQYPATVNFSDGTSRDLPQSSTWVSSDTSIAAVASGGAVTTKAAILVSE